MSSSFSLFIRLLFASGSLACESLVLLVPLSALAFDLGCKFVSVSLLRVVPLFTSVFLLSSSSVEFSPWKGILIGCLSGVAAFASVFGIGAVVRAFASAVFGRVSDFGAGAVFFVGFMRKIPGITHVVLPLEFLETLDLVSSDPLHVEGVLGTTSYSCSCCIFGNVKAFAAF